MRILRGRSGRCATLAAAVATCAVAVGAEPVSMPRLAYQLVLLDVVRDAPPLGERGIQRLQEEHLAWVEQHSRYGVTLVQGPVDGAGDTRSAALIAVDSADEAQAIVAGSSWVASERLRPRVFPWRAAGAGIRPPPSIVRTERVYLALVRWTAAAAEYEPGARARIEREQLDHLVRLVGNGTLVLGGPLEGPGPLRGAFVFRGSDPSAVVEAVRSHPASELGSMAIEVYPWHVPEASL